MNDVRPAWETQRTGGRLAIRAICLANCLLVILFFALQNFARQHEALFRAILTDAVVLAIQLWVLASTLFATVAFGRDLLKRSRAAAPAEPTPTAVALDGLFLLTWWMALLAVCLWAFMLGRSGF